jgi:anthranilate phosphoribosyltransferase
VEGGEVRSDTLDPVALGLGTAPIGAVAGGDLATNRRILEEVLQGRGSDPQRDVVVLNTALVLWAAGEERSLQQAVPRAREVLASAAAWGRVEALREALATAASGAGGG